MDSTVRKHCEVLPGQPSSSAAATASVCVGLGLLVLLVYAQVGTFEFVNLDDNIHVSENRHVNTGLTAQNVAWAFSIHGPGQWHPLAYLSHQLVYQYFGSGPRPHHLANLAFHLGGVIVLLLALRRMTGQLWPSALVAGLFGLHPLHVESVAWVCERRDVLCGFFWMLTLWAYALYAARGGWVRYLTVALFCALALMSKPMAVTLPCVLLLLDFWPLRRGHLGALQAADSMVAPESIPHRSWKFLVAEKAPLLALSAIASVLSVLCHSEAVVSLTTIPIHVRMANALIAYVVYLRKLVWPNDLAVWYPHPAAQPSFTFSSLILPATVSGLLLLAVTALVVLQARRRPYLAVGWFWYLGVLFPVSGLFQTGAQAYADHFTYLPLIGIYIAIAWGGAEIIARWRYAQPALIVAGPVLLAACLTITSIQVGTWRDNRTLYEHALLNTQDNALVQYNLGKAFLDDNNLADAQEHLEAALRIWPNYDKAHNNLAITMQRLGRLNEAIAHFAEAVRLNPNYADPQYNWGNALRDAGRLEEAVAHYQSALRLKPDYPEAHNNLGNVLQGLGRFDEAVSHYKEALRLNPDYTDVHVSWGNALQRMGQLQQAMVHFETVLRLKPDNAEAYNNVGVVRARQGLWQEAAAHFQRALVLKPDFTQARENLLQVQKLIQRKDRPTVP